MRTISQVAELTGISTHTHPTMVFMELRKKIVEEWLPSSGYMLEESPKIPITHWFRKPDNEKRYIELWIPVKKGMD